MATQQYWRMIGISKWVAVRSNPAKNAMFFVGVTKENDKKNLELRHSFQTNNSDVLLDSKSRFFDALKKCLYVRKYTSS